MTRPRQALVGLLGAVALAVGPLAPPAAAAPVEVQLLAVNDLHGYLQDPGSRVPVAAHVAGAVRAFEAQNPSTLFVGVGDLVGASPFVSASQQDAPTLDALTVMGMDVSAVGNHEFDRGYADLARRVVPRAGFPYLGANVQGESPALPPSVVRTLPNGVRVGFIGVVTRETATLVSPQGIAGITFTDPVAAANAEAARLRDRTDVLVLLAHEGAERSATTPEQCAELGTRADAFGEIVRGVSADVDAVFGGHTHLVVDCDLPVPGSTRTRPVLEGGQYGSHLARLRLTVDTATGSVRAVARDDGDGRRIVPVGTAFPADPTVKAVVDLAAARAARIGREPVGRVTADISRARTAAGAEDRGAESLLGNFIADVQLAATRDPGRGGSQVALMNPGGLRADFLLRPSAGEGEGVVTYEEAATVQPFANTLFTQTLTGAQLTQVLEEQFQPAGSSRPYLQLGLSRGLSFTADASRPAGSRITSVTLDGAPLVSTQGYRVTTNSFLAGGGDNFRTLTRGTDRRDTGLTDLDVLVAHFRANSPVTPATDDRAEVVGTATSTSPSPSQSPSASPTAGPTASPGPSATPTATTSPLPVPSTGRCPAGPSVVLSPPRVVAGRAARVVVPQLSASATVLLYAYTRPSDDYRLVRTGTGTGADLSFTVRPPANTRLFVVRTDCGPDEQPSVVLPVSTDVLLDVRRAGPRRYVLQGRVFPVRAGQLVNVYRVDGTREVLTAQARTRADGRWSVERRFLAGGRFSLVARTGHDLQNAAGVSRVRPVLVR